MFKTGWIRYGFDFTAAKLRDILSHLARSEEHDCPLAPGKMRIYDLQQSMLPWSLGYSSIEISKSPMMTSILARSPVGLRLKYHCSIHCGAETNNYDSCSNPEAQTVHFL